MAQPVGKVWAGGANGGNADFVQQDRAIRGFFVTHAHGAQTGLGMGVGSMVDALGFASHGNGLGRQLFQFGSAKMCGQRLAVGKYPGFKFMQRQKGNKAWMANFRRQARLQGIDALARIAR